ncbi:MAG: hypothetical protein AB9891_00220 [Anaerolineaceae bacterium]
MDFSGHQFAQVRRNNNGANETGKKAGVRQTREPIFIFLRVDPRSVAEHLPELHKPAGFDKNVRITKLKQIAISGFVFQFFKFPFDSIPYEPGSQSTG